MPLLSGTTGFERSIMIDHQADQAARTRLDKWLWAARFFKTRALAKAAIDGSKVHCRGERCKPGKEPRIGDEYLIRSGFDERSVRVLAVSGLTSVRLPAPSVRKDLENAGATWVDEEVHVDGRLITSRKPDDLPAFTAAIAKQLG